MTFSLKEKPRKPVLERRTLEIFVDYEDTLLFKSILEEVKKRGGDLDSIAISGAEEHHYTDPPSATISITYLESPNSATYKTRLEKFEEDMVLYEFWYSRNKERADAALLAEVEAEKHKEIKDYEARIRVAESKQRMVAFELERLRTELTTIRDKS